MTAAPRSHEAASHPARRTRAILFDNDGVLVDSEPLHRIAWLRVFGRYGIAVSDEEFAWSIGRRDVLFAERVIGTYGLPATAEGLRDEKRAHLLGLLAAEARTFRGIPELLDRLAATRRLGVATSAMRPEIEIVLDRFQFRPYFSAIVTNEDVTRHKPHPDPYLLCAERLGVRPCDCLVFEDSVTGLEAGKAAGMRVVAVATTFSPSELCAADAILESFADTEAVMRLVEHLELLISDS